MNNCSINYFDLLQYVDNIKLDKEVLKHLKATNEMFSKYFTKLGRYDESSIVYFLLDSFFNDLYYSSLCEGNCSPESYLDNSIFFDNLKISDKRINELHSFVTSGGKYDSFYRTNDNIRQVIFGYPDAKDVPKFMKDFIKIYKNNKYDLINSNPFLKSILMQILFVKIKPYDDGNRETARMLTNMKLTEMTNKYYGTKLKLSPINISKETFFNQLNYLTKLREIPFNLAQDPSQSINNFIELMLSMYDEELIDSISRLENYDCLLRNFPLTNDESDLLAKSIKKMKLERIKK